jgi:predicted CXXCH cytochrome family protein
VADTVHNLSVSGPGEVRAATERQICVFCHAPHNTGGLRPLWNRDVPASSYTIYDSSTLDALPGQPTGSSKLCLSCHDGTIALGNVLSRADRIRMVGGEFIPAGLSNLGTDLSDDHPISFPFTTGLAASDRQLVSPAALPPEVRLDAAGELQCTSCHDAHNNMFGDFLVMSAEFGRLCDSCHRMDGWSGGSHRAASVPMPATAEVDWPFATMAQNACRACHRPHTAGGHERLMIQEAEEDNCLNCHDGQAARGNILAEINKISAHDPRGYMGVHDPVESLSGTREHVECADCHNPHAASAQTQVSGQIPIGATLRKVPGVNIGGTQIAEARHEYEVCLRCHGDSAVTVERRIARQVQTSNLRLKFMPGNPSYHPVVVSADGSDAISLVPGLPSGSIIRCTDCHNNDSGPRAGGSGPDGPHGSIHDFLLERNYTTRDNNPESDYEYAMCYKCHQRNEILSDESFAYHSLHIVEARTPCYVCHDPHGVNTAVGGGGGDHTHLINFDRIVVQPEGTTGRMEFRDFGRFSGSCTLVCHGRSHVDVTYGLEP